MIKKLYPFFVIALTAISCVTLPNGDETLIQTPALGKDLPTGVEGLWETPTKPIKDPEQIESFKNLMRSKESSDNPQPVKLEELFEWDGGLDIILTIPTAYGDPSNTHIGDFLDRYYELRSLGVNNICILDKNTADALLVWKMMLFALHSNENLLTNAQEYAHDPLEFFKERLSKFRFISVRQPQEGINNKLTEFLGVDHFDQFGLGNVLHRSAAIVHQRKVIYHAIQNDEQCTRATSVNAIIKQLRQPSNL